LGVLAEDSAAARMLPVKPENFAVNYTINKLKNFIQSMKIA
jgi:hypothetical protein